MKKNIQIQTIVMLLIFSLSVFAQENGKHEEKEKKRKATVQSYIEISAGVSAPLGNFAKTSYSDNRSGYAAIGPIFAISGVKFIRHSNFGIGGTLSYSYYTLKGMENLVYGYHNDYGVDSVNEHNTSWKSIHALLGPYYSVPLGIVTLDFHAIAGINAMWSPEIDVLLEDGGNSNYNGGTQYTFWQKSSFSASVAIQLGAGLRISPVKHFAIAARVNYFYSRPVFDVSIPYALPSVGRYFTSYTQPFNGINATLGVDYIFGK